jgi:hypothetical protein
MDDTCYFAGDQVWSTKQKEGFYSEVLGSTQGTSRQICIKSFFDTRACSQMNLYNFRIACRGGLATTPQLFLALFGNDKSTRESGFSLVGANQLSYIDPLRDFSGSMGQRVYLPIGYAPLHTTDINGMIRRLSWDDANQHPALPRSLSIDQERRIKELFVARVGYVEPFPESNIRRAAAIGEERPPPPPLAPSIAKPREEPTHQSTGSHPAGLNVAPNSSLALGLGIMFVAFLAWVFGTATRMLSGEKPNFWRQVAVESISLIVSGIVLYSLGVVDEIKWLSIPLVGGLSIAIVSSARHA